MANDLLGGLIKTAIDAYISTLTDAQKADWTDAQRKTLLEKMFNPVEDYQAPIGSIVAWHKSLSGVPSLPGNWAECNGQTISDSDSPLDGVTLPDLNGEKRFLRGDSTSGTNQADAFQGHAPDLSGSGGGGGITYPIIDGNAPGRPYNGVFQGWISDGVNGTPRIANETRPVNMSVVWIIRIK